MNSLEAIGIDLGSSNAVIAAAKHGGAEIIINEASNRETQVIVGFGDNERFIGEQGFVQLKSNFKNTIIFPTRFLGQDPNSIFLPEEKKWLYTPVISTEQVKLGFEVTIRGEKVRFLPEQVVAMMLQKIKHICAKARKHQCNIVLSVPVYYTSQERKALLDAAKIAQINILKLLNESTAIATDYALSRIGELNSNPRNVCFIDFGHSSTGVFVASFTKEKTMLHNQVYQRNLGTRDFDWMLLEFYGKILTEKHGCDIITQAKSRLRLLDAIEKQRKILSANSDAVINLEYIFEDYDLTYTLTRQKFEEIISPLVEKFKSMLTQLKVETKIPLHSIEIIGGGTRIPLIQRVIQQVFDLECSRTLNASECIARGCALHAEMMINSKNSHIVEETNYYLTKGLWRISQNDIHGNVSPQTETLFSRGCLIPSVKELTLFASGKIEFDLVYEDSVEGNKVLERYSFETKNPERLQNGIKIAILLNKNGILELIGAEAFGIEKEAKSPELDIEIQSLYGLSEDKILELAELELEMAYQDKMASETSEKKNEFEAYIYEFRRKLNEKYNNYVSAQEQEKIIHDLEKVETWLYGEGVKASKVECEDKFEDVKRLANLVEMRYKEYEVIPVYLSQFSNVLSNFENIMVLKNSNYSYISSANRQTVREAIKSNRAWIDDISNRLKNTAITEDPPITSKELIDKMQGFLDKFSPLLSKPK